MWKTDLSVILLNKQLSRLTYNEMIMCFLQFCFGQLILIVGCGIFSFIANKWTQNDPILRNLNRIYRIKRIKSLKFESWRKQRTYVLDSCLSAFLNYHTSLCCITLYYYQYIYQSLFENLYKYTNDYSIIYS